MKKVMNVYTMKMTNYKAMSTMRVFEFVKAQVTCNINDKADIPSSWILSDSQSLVDVFATKKFLRIYAMRT